MIPVFKTSEECEVVLIAYTQLFNPQGDEDGMESCDLFPATAARVSFGNDLNVYDSAKDEKLINYLADHEHTSTFEHQSATFMIECPLFIRSQIHRHRTFSYNEISRRYTSEELEFWIPDVCRGQAKNNKQASDGVVTEIYPGLEDLERRVEYEEVFGKVPPSDPANHFKIEADSALGLYNDLLAGGVSREQARAVLPQSLLTRFYMTGNLRNWAHFLELRRAEHSQQEVQVVANKVADKLRELWPTSCKALGI